jgi:hypothetical protein
MRITVAGDLANHQAIPLDLDNHPVSLGQPARVALP